MQKKINYNISDISVSLFLADTEKEYMEIEKKLETVEKEMQEDYRTFYSALKSGEIDYFYIESERNITVWTASARKNVLIQRTSFMQTFAGELIPLSHHNINTFSDMIKDGLKDNVILKSA